MKNKVLIGIGLLVLISAVMLAWYFTGDNVSIAGIDVPPRVGTQYSGWATIVLQNNASKEINVTLKVKNTLEDEKGNTLPPPIAIVESSHNTPYTIIEYPEEVNLKPGKNEVNVFFGFQVPGIKKIEVQVYQKGRLVDSTSTEIEVFPPVIGVSLQYANESHPGYTIYKVFGNLSNTGMGGAQGVEVNISIINETTKAIISSTKRGYTLLGNDSSYPMSEWEVNYWTRTPRPIALVELSSGATSDEKYLDALTVAKGNIGGSYRVVVIARWQDQTAKAEMTIPP